MFSNDRLIASRAARTSNVVPYVVIDRVLQVSDPFSEIAPYNDVTDRIVQVSDRLLTSRHTMTSYRDVTDRVTQVSDRLLTSRHTMTSYRDVTDRVTQVSDPFSENDPFSEITVNRPSCTSESPHLSGTVSMMAIGSFERESFRLVEFSKRVSHWSMSSVFYNVRN